MPDSVNTRSEKHGSGSFDALARQVLDSIAEGCQVIGPDYRYLYVNDAAAAQGRTTKERLLGRTMLEAYPGIERTEMFSVLCRCMEDRSPRRMENEFTFPDGSKGWFDLRFEPMPQGVTILSVDVTRRKRDEAERERAEELFRKTFHASPVASVLSKLPDRTIIDVNEAFERLFGYARADVVGRPVPELDIWAVPAQRDAASEILFRDGKLVAHEIAFKTRAGRTGAGLFYSEIFQIRDERYAHTEIVDITERRHAEQAARESEARFREILEVSPVPFTLNDEQQNITYLNPTFVRTFGYDRSDIPTLAEWWLRAYPDPEYRAWVASTWQAHLDHAKRTGAPFEPLELNIRCKDGSTRTVLVGAAALEREFRSEHLVTLIDITERKKMEELLNTSLRLGEYALSHTLDELLTQTLDEAELLTGSRIGFFHFLDADQKTLWLQNWSSNTLQKMCTATGKGQHYPMEEAGVWVDCIRKRRPVIHNDYFSLPHRKGLPDGHAPVIRELVVPITRGGKSVGIIGVGNKPDDYNEKDIEILNRLANFAWEIVESKRAEEALNSFNRDFEAFLSQTTDFIYFKDIHSRFRFCSQTLAAITGHADWHEMIGKHDREVFPLDTAIIYEEEEAPVLSEGRPLLNKIDPFYDSAGRLGHVQTNRWPLFDASGQIVGIFGISRDITEQQRAEAALRASEEKYRLLFENAADAIFIHDMDARMLAVNPQACERLGYTYEELMSMGIQQVDTPAEASHVPARIAKLMTEGRVVFETVHQRKDGSLVPTEVNARKIIWEHIPAIMSICRDISKRKQIEQKLRLRAAELEGLLRASRLFASTLDLPTVLQSITAQGATLLEVETTALYLLERPESEDLHLAATTPPLPPQFPDALRRARLADHPHIKQALTSGQPVVVADATVVSLTEAERVAAEARGLRTILYVPLLVGEKRIGVLIWGTVEKPRAFSQEQIDVGCTLCNQAAIAIQNVRQFEEKRQLNIKLEGRVAEGTAEIGKLSRAIEQSPASIVITDTQGNIEYVNPKFCELTGYTIAEVLGKTPRIMKSGETSSEEYKQLWDTILAGREWRGELHNKRKNGELYWESASISPIFDENGAVTHFVGVNEDITERKLAEAEQELTSRRLLALVELAERSAEPLADTGQFLLNAAIALSGSEIGFINFVSADGTTYQPFVYSQTVMEACRTTGLGHFPIVGGGWWTEAFRSKKSLVINDYAARHPAKKGLPDGHVGLERFIVVPVVDQDKVVMLLAVGNKRTDYTEIDAVHLRLLADGFWRQSRARRIEATLKASEARYRALFDNVADGIVLHDLGEDHLPGPFVEFNDVACRMLGYSREELLRLTPLDLEAPECRGRALVEAERMLREGRAIGERQVVTGRGQRLFLEISSQIIMLAGQPMVISVLRDISERKRTEAMAAARLRLLDLPAGLSQQDVMQRALDEICAITDSPIGFFHLMQDDQRTLLLTAWSTHTLRGFCTAQGGEMLYDLDQAGVWADCVRQRRPVIHNDYGSLPHRKGLPPGHPPVVRQMSVPIVRGDLIVAVAGVGNKTGDYTDEDLDAVEFLADFTWEQVIRKRAQDELLASEEDFRLLMHNLIDGVIVLDDKDRIMFANPRAHRILARGELDLVGLLFGVPIDATGKTELDIPFGEDGVRTVLMNATDASWRGRKGRLVVLTDVTEQRRSELALIEARIAADEANQAKSVFLANMSHEIRTPMNAVLGFAQLMQREHGLTPLQRGYLESILRGGDHLLLLINDILQISKIEAGRVELHETALDLHGLLSDLATMFRTRAEAKGLRLVEEMVGSVPRYVVADEGKLRQVLSNLLGNAVKFTAQGGIAARVRAEAAEGSRTRLVFEIEDSGAGIDKGDLPRLFNKFEQTEAGRRAGVGTGLGLAISRELIQLMGGKISVISTPGKGSTFRFDVLVDVFDAAAVKVEPRRPRVRSLKAGQPCYLVLVVDDQQDNRAVLSGMLKSVGFEVRLAVDGAEAVREFESSRPALVLMDMRMPVLDGRAAIARIRAMAGGREVKIIIVTASTFEEERKEALASGADDFIGKPFRESELFAKIKRLLGVEYAYEESEGVEEPDPLAAMPVGREALAELPAELVERLHGAVLSADLDLALELLVQVEERDAGLGHALRAMAERFEYKHMMAVLSAREGNDETKP